ncbi:hypothetical protein TSAR_013831 [Trichomalopsis sarcophagae]|uniref:BTB domain-containing protein n=1 Tax=Trichomalopsis sarcophagae TaxID=543379 RepID=A0A232F7X4_9HYME|nr:hypothetical protein TSAR_013831 [Trichomalopsis sarcophagae]
MDANNNNTSSRSNDQTSLSNSSSNVDMSENVVKCCGANSKHLMMSDGQSTCANSDYRCVSTQGLQSLNDLRQNNLLCDAVLKLEDGGVFPVHRAILSACSTYFRTLFTTTLNPKNNTEFLVSNVSSKIMNLLLEYAYLRTIDIKQEDVCELLITADYLVIDGVLELCCDFLRRSLTVKNCIGIMIFAREHFCKDLEKEARRYLLRYFVQV